MARVKQFLEPLNSPERDVYLLCFNISLYSHTAKFVICSSGVFLFFLVYGYFQELIFQLEGFRPYGMYLTLIQFIFYTIFGYIERYLRQDLKRRIPFRMLVFLAILTVATMGLSNTSVGYLNYPTQVVFKCCKLIPVLFGGIFIQGKRYGVMDFISAGFMSVGLALFTLTDVELSPNFSLTGVILVSLALVADAAIGNYQEKNMKEFSASTVEVVYYSYFIGCFFIFLCLVALRQLVPAFLFCAENPVQTYGYGCIFSMAGYGGIQIVLILVHTFGAFTAVTVTTFRKALTLVLSFILFAKPFSMRYVWSGLIVVLGIYLNVYSKKLHCQDFFLNIREVLYRRRKLYSLSSFRSGNIVSSV